MKLTIESLGAEKAKVTLNFKGKEYSETWEKNEFGYGVIDKSIVAQMESDEVCCEGTDIEYLLENLDIDGFITISEKEDDW